MKVFPEINNCQQKTNKQTKQKEGGSAFRLGLIYILCLNVYFFSRRCVLQEVWVSLAAKTKEQDPAIVL